MASTTARGTSTAVYLDAMASPAASPAPTHHNMAAALSGATMARAVHKRVSATNASRGASGVARRKAPDMTGIAVRTIAAASPASCSAAVRAANIAAKAATTPQMTDPNLTPNGV